MVKPFLAIVWTLSSAAQMLAVLYTSAFDIGSQGLQRTNKPIEAEDPEKEAWRLSTPEFQTGVADTPR